jgi:hypothetical protein
MPARSDGRIVSARGSSARTVRRNCGQILVVC